MPSTDLNDDGDTVGFMSISDEKYVSITTYRRSGEAVSSPVWVAPLADGTCGFTTGLTSGKVKRLRNDARVTLRACDMRGRVAPGAVEVAGRAAVLVGEPAMPVRAAIVSKYGLMARVMVAGSSVKERVARLRKRPVEPECAVVITLEA